LLINCAWRDIPKKNEIRKKTCFTGQRKQQKMILGHQKFIIEA
jgi:hypothetical protein